MGQIYNGVCVIQTDNNSSPTGSYTLSVVNPVATPDDIIQGVKAYNWQGNLVVGTLRAAEQAYPVGSIYMNVINSVSPASLLGFGTWEEFGAGRVLLGAGTGTDSNGVSKTFNASATGGEYEHTLTTSELPPYTSNVSLTAEATSGEVDDVIITTATSGATSGGDAHNNIQPYITVYMWKRVS